MCKQKYQIGNRSTCFVWLQPPLKCSWCFQNCCLVSLPKNGFFLVPGIQQVFNVWHMLKVKESSRSGKGEGSSSAIFASVFLIALYVLYYLCLLLWRGLKLPSASNGHYRPNVSMLSGHGMKRFYCSYPEALISTWSQASFSNWEFDIWALEKEEHRLTTHKFVAMIFLTWQE